MTRAVTAGEASGGVVRAKREVVARAVQAAVDALMIRTDLMDALSSAMI